MWAHSMDLWMNFCTELPIYSWTGGFELKLVERGGAWSWRQQLRAACVAVDELQNFVMQKQHERSVWCTVFTVKNNKKKKNRLKEKLHKRETKISREARKEQ
jgi:hypothetical protein